MSPAIGQASSQTPAEPIPKTAEKLTAADFHAPDTQLSGLVERLLTENPEVRSVWARSTSSFERVPQERSLPDPQLTYRYFVRSPETRVGPQEQALEISQGLPWAGKRDLQARRAESMASGTTWEAEDTERRLVADLKRAYFEAAYLQEALRVNRDERELLSRFERTALKRYSTGEGIQQSVVKVQTDISRLDDREYALHERLQSLVRRMSELVGAPEAPVALSDIVLPFPEVECDRAEMESTAVAEHPRVRALERRVEADHLWASRRKLEGRPDFRVGVGYTVVGDREDPAGVASPPPDNGKDAVALTAGVNIPVFRRRVRAGVAEARESERANAQALESARNRIRFDIQEGLLRVDSLDERARLFRDVIIPQAEESLASAEAAYTTDRLGFLDLLDAERVLFQSRLAFHRLVSDLWIALTEVERALARPFPAPRSGPPADPSPGTGTRS